MNGNQLTSYIDHTLLKADATEQHIIQLCTEAKQYRFATVCIHPCWVKLAAEQLQDDRDVGITTVIGFPLGANATSIKALEAQQAVVDGATEIDMVLNVGYLKSRFLSAVKSDIEAVVNASGATAIVKVILETSLLTNEEIVIACQLAVEAGAKYVKTSTGFSSGGATTEHIALMRHTVGERVGVKASGGIRDYDTTVAMIKAGASRIGASAGISIVNKAESAPSDY